MSAFYDRMQATASRLLKQYGATATVTHVTTGEYDPDTGEASTTTEAFTGSAAVFDYDQKLVDGMVIQKGDKKALIENIAIVPSAVDVFGWQGQSYQIIAVKPLSPAGINCLYELQIRGGA